MGVAAVEVATLETVGEKLAAKLLLLEARSKTAAMLMELKEFGVRVDQKDQAIGDCVWRSLVLVIFHQIIE